MAAEAGRAGPPPTRRGDGDSGRSDRLGQGPRHAGRGGGPRRDEGDAPGGRIRDLPALMFVTPTEAVRHVWNDRLSRHQVAPPDRTLQPLSARFLELSEARMTTGDLSASELDTARRCVGHVVDFFGGSNDPGVITAGAVGGLLEVPAQAGERGEAEPGVRQEGLEVRQVLHPLDGVHGQDADARQPGGAAVQVRRRAPRPSRRSTWTRCRSWSGPHRASSNSTSSSC